MAHHELRCIFYPVNSQLQTNPYTLSKYLIRHRPKVVIVLHAAGITNQLFAQNKIWLKYLTNDALLIEDCVHRLVDPKQIKLLTPNHFVIDSLRKVAPIYGSNLYGDATTLSGFKQSPWSQTIPYQLQVFWWWWLFQVCLHVGLNRRVQKYMKIGYDLIGDSKHGAPGLGLFNFLSRYFNLVKIESVKKQQVARYSTVLNDCWNNQFIYQIDFDHSDAGKLRGYPVGINLEKADRLLVQLQKYQLAWKYELDDCPWSKRQKIIYLPLGPYIQINEVDTICQLFNTALKNVNSVVS